MLTSQNGVGCGDMLQNVLAVIAHLLENRPQDARGRTAKGRYFANSVLSSTMGPGVPLYLGERETLLKRLLQAGLLGPDSSNARSTAGAAVSSPA